MSHRGCLQVVHELHTSIVAAQVAICAGIAATSGNREVEVTEEVKS